MFIKEAEFVKILRGDGCTTAQNWVDSMICKLCLNKGPKNPMNVQTLRHSLR